jgi:hypothetical protein
MLLLGIHVVVGKSSVVVGVQLFFFWVRALFLTLPRSTFDCYVILIKPQNDIHPLLYDTVLQWIYTPREATVLINDGSPTVLQ